MDVNFAEIEYEITPPKKPQTISSQSIKPQASDPIRDRFMAMRRIFYDNPYSRNDAELFYKQMKFMEDYEDDYPGDEPFSMYYPNYQYMSYEQLRTYFTWRTNARHGRFSQTSISYIFVYIYELLANIGVKSPTEGLVRLMTIWQTMKEEAPVLDKYFLIWLKDYHVYYDLDFKGFVDEHNFMTSYPENFIFDATPDNCLYLWNTISFYDIKKSPFCKKKNQELMVASFFAVIQAIEAEIDLRVMLTHETQMSVPWRPFSHALFYPWLEQPNRKTILPGGEVYYCKDNIWTADITIYQNRRKFIAGYMIKKTEEVLRVVVGHKGRFSALNDRTFRSFFGFKEKGFTRHRIDDVIAKTVEDYYQSTKRTVVTVDTTNLDRIRIEAQSTQDLLVVPENTEIQPSPVGVVSSRPQPAETVEIQEDPWANLKNTLTPTEIEVLQILLHDSTGFVPFANSHSIMPEALLDSINEKSTDHMGDSILDEDFVIYEDYINKVKEMVE